MNIVCVCVYAMTKFTLHGSRIWLRLNLRAQFLELIWQEHDQDGTEYSLHLTKPVDEHRSPLYFHFFSSVHTNTHHVENSSTDGFLGVHLLLLLLFLFGFETQRPTFFRVFCCCCCCLWRLLLLHDLNAKRKRRETMEQTDSYGFQATPFRP